MVDIVIFCPVEVEFKIIRKILINSKSTHYQNLSFDFGQIKGSNFDWSVAIIEPEHNLGSFSLKVNEVITILNPKYVFLGGIAGGIKDSKIGDIVIGTKAYLYEGGKETKDGFVARPRIIENGSKELLTLAKRLTREINSKDISFHFGAIASGNKILASLDSRSAEIIKKHYNDTQAIEMESYEFAQASSHSEKPYLNIRGISDLIDGKAKSDSEGHQKMASKKVANFLQQLVYNLPSPPQTEHYITIVNSSSREFSYTEIRKYMKTTLTFKDDFIEVTENGKTYVLRKFKKIEYFKMVGDFKQNWVRIIFLNEEKEEERFYSEPQLFNIGNWIGGSKKLLEAFKLFEKRQLPLNAFI